MSGIGDHGRLLVIEHELNAPAGLLGRWARARGLALSIVHLGAGDRLPARLPARPAECAGLVLLGSEQTAFDDPALGSTAPGSTAPGSTAPGSTAPGSTAPGSTAPGSTVPWLAGELSLVRQAVADGVPVLGICFGGQVLARALGARVYRLPEPEIGWVRLASRHPGLPAGPWLEWHQDGFDLPPGARELATGGASAQAYAIGPHVGVQFHPEVTEPIAAGWLRASQPPLAPAVAGRLRQGWPGAAGRTAVAAGTLFSAWLDGGFARPAPRTAGADAAEARAR